MQVVKHFTAALLAERRRPVLVRLETSPNIAVGPGDWGPFRLAGERGLPVLTVDEAGGKLYIR